MSMANHIWNSVFLSDAPPLCLAKGDTESQWLRDTGLSGLVGGLGSDDDHQGLLSTLTPTQVAAVCRRLDTYARSARRRHKPPIRDVRDIFGVFTSRVSKGHWALSLGASVMSVQVSCASLPATVSPGCVGLFVCCT